VADGAMLDLLEFRLAKETYALEHAFVREVVPLENLTPLPGTPKFVRGVVNVRGQILAVIDIKKLFDLPDDGITDLHRVIIVQAAGAEVGILADVVTTVRSQPLASVQLSLPTLTGIREAYLRGISPEQVVILDVQKILSDRTLMGEEQPC
jgi:purine-binding chemotaxis protein CheW